MKTDTKHPIPTLPAWCAAALLCATTSGAPTVRAQPAPAPTAPAAPPATVPAAPSTTTGIATTESNADDSRLRQQTELYNSGLAALESAKTEAKNGGADAVARRLAEAADSFEKTLQIAPDDAMARVLLGYVRLKQERYDDALTNLRMIAGSKALDVKTRAVVQNNIGMALWNKKDFKLALPAYEAATTLDKDYADARYNLAFALLAQARAADALPHFTLLLSRNKRDPLLHDGLGQAHESMGEWDKAFASYREAIRLNPRDSSYPLNLGLALLRSDPDGKIKGRRNSAVPPLREAIRLNPEAAPAYLQLGLMYIDKKNWPGAQNMLRQYASLRPDDFVGQFNLGLAYDYSSRFDDALRHYAIAEKLQPTDPATRNNIGRINLKRAEKEPKSLDEAIAKFREALNLDPDFVDARNNLALALTQRGDLDAAGTEWKRLIASANRQLKATPDPGKRNAIFTRVVSARAALAENYLKARMYADAAEEYKRLLAISKKNIAAMSNLGLALYNTRQYLDALKAYDRIVKLGAVATNKVPRDQLAIAYNNRGVVLEAMKKVPDALASYKKAIEIQPDYAEAKTNRERLIAGTVVG